MPEGDPCQNLLNERQQVLIGEQHLVASVADHVGYIVNVKPGIQSVENCPQDRNGHVGFEMLKVVEPQCGNAIARTDSGA